MKREKSELSKLLDCMHAQGPLLDPWGLGAASEEDKEGEARFNAKAQKLDMREDWMYEEEGEEDD